jgi:hypothetical protein
MKAVIPCLCLSLIVCSGIVARADDQESTTRPAVHLTVARSSTPVTEILAALGSQTGATILPDSSVQDTLDSADIHGMNLYDALNGLVKLVPGLSWNKVYLPANARDLDVEDLSAAIRALHKVGVTELAIAGPADSSATIVHKSGMDQVPQDRRVVYVVTNEAARDRQQQQMQAAVKPANYGPQQPAPSQNPDELVQSTMSDLNSLATTFQQMTPDEQSQIMPLIWKQLRYITSHLPPEVLNRFEHTVPSP